MINWQWVGFILIAVAVPWVYAPALLHIPRADNVCFFCHGNQQARVI